MRFIRLFATAAVVAGSLVGFAAPASADTLCEQAWVRGEPLLNPTDAGQCFPYNSPWCDFEGIATSGNEIGVYVYVCLPAG